MLQLSPSKINTYKLCPFKYKCDSDYLTKKAYRRDTPELTFGSLIHACLNDYFLLPQLNRNHKNLRKIFQEKFMVHYQKHLLIFKNQKTINSYVKEAKKQFKIFLDSPLADGNIFKMKDKLQKWQINENLIFMGLVDRIDYNDHELTIIDYKTGRLREEFIFNLQFQVDCYQYLIAKKFPDYKVAKKILFFLKENRVVEYKVVDIDDIESQLLHIADVIRKDKELLPKKNKLCGYCDYKVICPLFNREIE